MDLYVKNNAVREFYDFYLDLVNENELAGKYKRLIIKEFNVSRPEQSGLIYSVAKRAIADFRDLQPSPETLADVMLTLPECACKFTYTYGDMEESFYIGAYNNFVAALKFMHKQNLLDDF
ncbi:MAG: hypothetical protein JXR27_11785 [Paludibacteraceae bacterium]|nr:hypothetical protein [Paludibacteraceae bacterium]